MTIHGRIALITLFGLELVGFAPSNDAGAAAPTAAQALQFRPVQDGVDYDRPNADEVKECSIKPEKENGNVAWVVRDANGDTLRRFADTNGDKVVDQWKYFKSGLEVYRDIDTNFNGKADQHRWCHSEGTRWGVDTNENGEIDAWRVIAPEEVAEEVIHAIRDKDAKRFARLLISEKELAALGLSAAHQKSIASKVEAATSRFQELLAKQKVISKSTTYVDFTSARPGVIPSGTDGSTEDITVYENVAAFVLTEGRHDQVALGSMIRVGATWKIIDAPVIGDSEQANTPGQFFFAARSNRPDPVATRPADAPSEAETKLMSEMEKVDAEVASSSGEKRVKLNDRRADLLEQLADAATDPKQRALWLSQLADTISAEVQSGFYEEGLKRLEKLQTELARQKGQEDLVAHIAYRRLTAEYGLSLQAPKADYTKIQKNWLEQLEAFVKDYADSPITADALLQLGMAEEFSGEDSKAEEWYARTAKQFASTASGAKAAGALRRLKSIDKEFDLRGPAATGGVVDVAEYRGKVVLIQYWATWCEPCKSDMARLKELYAKYAGRGFAIVGVSLDHSKDELTAYLDEHRVPWKHVFEEGGLDSRPANEMGILTLPTMLLIDKNGNVISRNIHVAELSGELKKLLE